MEARILDRLEPVRVEPLRGFYGADWADAPSRQAAVLALRETAAPGFRWRLAARLPPVDVPLVLAELIGEMIERDFSAYRLRPTRVDEERAGQTLVIGGWVFARTRCSREALRRCFQDTWSFEGGRPAMLESR